MTISQGKGPPCGSTILGPRTKAIDIQSGISSGFRKCRLGPITSTTRSNPRQNVFFRYIDLRMKLDSSVVVRPARTIRGSVELPGDKSISHRYGMLSGIAEGPSRIENYSTGADCASTLACMRSLGVTSERKDGNII